MPTFEVEIVSPRDGCFDFSATFQLLRQSVFFDAPPYFSSTIALKFMKKHRQPRINSYLRELLMFKMAIYVNKPFQSSCIFISNKDVLNALYYYQLQLYQFYLFIGTHI